MKYLITAVSIFCVFLIGAEAFGAKGYYKPKRHFLSWESLNRPEDYKKLTRGLGSNRRFDVHRRRVVKLKPSSLWNRRPYQFATPHYNDGVIYVGCDDGFFYAINTKLPGKIWTFKTEGPVSGEAQVEGDVVYVGDGKANVYALNKKTGEEIWRTRLDAEILSKPLVYEDMLYVSTMSGRLFAMDRASGLDIWHTPASERGFGFSVRRSSSPVYFRGGIFVGTPTGLLIAFNSDDGGIIWARQLGNRRAQVYDVDSMPLFVGKNLWAASADGELFALDPITGEIEWVFDAGGPNNILHHEGRLFTSGAGVLHSLDPETGKIFWEQDLETPGISTPAGGKGYIAVVDTEDKMYLVDSMTGDIMFERYVRKGTFGDPIIVDDNLYVLANTGRLFSFKIRELKPRKRRTQNDMEFPVTEEAALPEKAEKAEDVERAADEDKSGAEE